MCPQPYFLPEKMVAHFVIEQTLHEPGVCFQNRKTENSVPFLQQKILMPSAPPTRALSRCLQAGTSSVSISRACPQ